MGPGEIHHHWNSPLQSGLVTTILCIDNPSRWSDSLVEALNIICPFWLLMPLDWNLLTHLCDSWYFSWAVRCFKIVCFIWILLKLVILCSIPRAKSVSCKSLHPSIFLSPCCANTMERERRYFVWAVTSDINYMLVEQNLDVNQQESSDPLLEIKLRNLSRFELETNWGNQLACKDSSEVPTKTCQAQ